MEIKREIQAYSSNSDGELDYKKSYWFHHWITKKRALIENEKGELLEANYNEFRFKTKLDNEQQPR